MTTYPLEGSLLKFVEQRMAQINRLEAQIEGAISLHVTERDLGNWQFDWPNRQLVLQKPEPVGTAEEHIEQKG